MPKVYVTQSRYHPAPSHPHPHPHHHHHHRGDGTAFALGMGALAGVILAGHSRPTTPEPVVVKIIETREQREERERERERILEARRAEQSRRREELQRKRMADDAKREEQRMLENVLEQERTNNYKEHLKLIDDASSSILYFDEFKKRIEELPWLKEPINRFCMSVYKNIPESKSKNLFNCVLTSQSLSDYEKNILLSSLLFKGYEKYCKELFKNPAFDVMYQSNVCFKFLSSLYLNHYLQPGYKDIDIFQERMIWNKMLLLEIEDPLTLSHLLGKDNDKKRQYQFLLEWINSQATAIDVVTVYKTIGRQLNLPENVTNGFYKVCKQKILSIDIYAEREPNDIVDDFLNTHRDSASKFFSCFFQPRSGKINQMIAEKRIFEAQSAIDNEDDVLKNGFYRAFKLSK